MSLNRLFKESCIELASAFDQCVKERPAFCAGHVQHSLIKLFIVLLAVVWGMGATVANAQDPPPTDIHTYVACLNTIQKTNQTVADAVRCVPSGCNYTVTMSPFSAQPACTKDGVKLPRVIFSCPGPAVGLRFRPSFTLCPETSLFGDAGNKTELGEDVDIVTGIMKMADVENPPLVPNFAGITEADVLSTVLAGDTIGIGSKKCNICHGPVTPGAVGSPQLSKAISPFTFLFGPFVIDTNEPGQTVGPNPMSLTDVCSAIENSQALAQDTTVDRLLLIRLCERLDGKIENSTSRD